MLLSCYRHPNNPTGELRKPLVQDKSHVMYDMVYYWPMYAHTDVKMSEVVAIMLRADNMLYLHRNFQGTFSYFMEGNSKRIFAVYFH